MTDGPLDPADPLDDPLAFHAGDAEATDRLADDGPSVLDADFDDMLLDD